MDDTPRPYVGIPAFFKSCCDHAETGKGKLGYYLPGYELTRRIYRLVPDETTVEEWSDEVGRMAALVFHVSDENWTSP